MILAAGRGARLAPLTDHCPKPLIPVGGAPLIVHQLRWLRLAGVRDVVINLHHLGGQIEAAVGDGGALGLRVAYSREDALLDTGGGIRKALPRLRPGPFLVLNGDIWTDHPFSRLLATRPASAHLVLTPTPPHKAQPDFHLERDGRTVRRNPALDDLTYCGFGVFTHTLFAHAPDGPFSLRDLLFAAAAEGTLNGERFEGAWIDIGTPDQLERARRLTA